MKNSFLLFDALYLFFTIIVYSVAGTLACYFGSLIWGESIPSKVIAVVIGYFVFLHLFIITVALLRKLIQKPLKKGTFPIGLNEDYIAWGFNSIFHGIVIASPFASQIFFVFYLNWMYYNLMGMKLPINSLIGTNATIRQPELIEIGPSTVIGIGSTIVGHYSPDRKRHCQGGIKIGENSLVGAYTMISPSTSIGNNTIIGHNGVINPLVKIGNNVSVGPETTLRSGAKLPDNVTIKANSIIDRSTRIKEGETWGGNPAILISTPHTSEAPQHEES